MIELAVVAVYLLALLAIGYWGYRKSGKTPEDYFVANRSLGKVVLFFTLAATNFSAFFFFGFAGAAYTHGYSYYGIMAFGTAFIAVMFYVLGRRIWRLGKAYRLITPSELVGERFKSDGLRVLFLAVMVLFTIPYLATQPIGGGIALSKLTDGLIPFETGAVIITIAILFYVLLGGMRSDAWTDVLQGVIMIIAMLSAFGIVLSGLGGLEPANQQLLEQRPELFSRPGASNFFTPQIWFSFMILWSLANLMFPQLFVRFYAAKDENAIKWSALLYPIITIILFTPPIILGVLGNQYVPGLLGKEADQILPKMVSLFSGPLLAAILMTGSFAALMSTADSQLLAMSSMLTRDVYARFINRQASQRKQLLVGRLLVAVLALVGLAVALTPQVSIFELLASTTFTGLAILFPTAFAALYWKKATANACILSIVSGELAYLAFYFGLIPKELAFGFLPAIPLVAFSSFVLIVASLLGKPDQRHAENFLAPVENK
ncbi:MAG: sodium:solute symporter family protein [Candidatus Aenigmarchaeota archaeon]|nr:sodium:solute symporter family protein [Candidatus Aenigmarchaeota archaeon]